MIDYRSIRQMIDETMIGREVDKHVHIGWYVHMYFSVLFAHRPYRQ